ncbi:AI-2E family transporter [Microbacterium trichothecenolyticum]|uniref:AI-2E family transporter n=1 Tax=Microbacterium ureisolvens TaxID=2781186 RepID=A0ABS7HYL3_9MICO|nr:MULTISPECIES: AI-2E family transporter [Microbacterium]MBW9109409.1 AI-2E family transporter [Microbacterium ureisolvens]MBW9119943.1 AI-2E family transporter [Microbacterium trichothecenolyticum]
MTDPAEPVVSSVSPEEVVAVAQERPRRFSKVLAGLDHPLATGFLVTIGVLAALVLGSAIGSISTILVYIVLAMFLAVGLDPIVRMLERHKVKRGAGIAIVFAGFALVMVAFFVFVLPPVVAQIVQLVQAIPELVENIPQSEWFARLAPDAQVAVLGALEQIAEWVSAPSTLAALGGGVLAVGVGFVAAISASFVVIALTLYFLASLTAAKRAFYDLAPAHSRVRLADLTERITDSVGSALIGSVILSSINAAVVFVLHVVIGLPFPALMAVIAFVVTLIPLFGSVIFWIFASIIALFTSPEQALIFFIAYLVYIQIESYVVSPRVMNKAIEIPAALVLIGALAGGALAGIVGVLVALPVMASILLIIREVVVPRQNLKV